MTATATAPTRRRSRAAPPTRDDPATKYARDVVAGRIVTGSPVRHACARHLHDLAHAGARGWTFDRELAQRALDFFPKLLRLNAGEFEGKPFVLEPWQAFVVGSLFGWIDQAGRRRFRVAFVETGKGSGKSPLSAGIGLYMMLADNEARSEVYAAASKKDQALILFRDAVAMVNLSPAIAKRVRVIGGTNPWNLVFGSSFFRPISSDEGQSGPRPHCALIDELHEHRDDNVVEMLRAGFKFRRSPLMFMITNSGVDRLTVCWRYHTHALRVADRTIEDDRFFGYVCALDDTDDPFEDEACWIKTNPSLGVTIQPDYIRDQVREAGQMPAKESTVRRLHFCQWVDAASPWISGDAWRACEVPGGDDPLERFEGRPVILAVDLSATTDLTALAIVADDDPDDDQAPVDAAVEFWTPLDTLRAREERDSVPYELWAKQGHLNTVPGSTLDYGPIAVRIGELVERLDVQAVVFDRYRMTYLRRELRDIGLGELPLREHPQGWLKLKSVNLWMPQSINILEALLLEQHIRVVANPVLTWSAASAVVALDQQGSRVFSKRKSTGRIDGVVALAMGVGALRTPDDQIDVSGMIV